MEIVMHADVLVIGAHPDDIELSCGGTVAKLANEGHAVALAELTRGELGTRGNEKIRGVEATNAAKIMGVSIRRNLEIPDGNIELNRKNLLKVISLIRELRPRILLIPHFHERHPDHVHAHHLCKEAWFYAGLRKIRTTLRGKAQSPHRPDNYFHYMQKFEFQPTFVVDVSDFFEQRMQAIRAHASQFHNPSSTEPETVLSHPSFLDDIRSRALYFGQTIGVKYGEPFYSPVPLGIKSPFDLVLTRG
ncbi:MAG: bacillithiol biosynthesis deacetylase BshB1 [Bacteroidetes bacterium]|jgi:bacillithiol biosynthesis deacetylase BshB1|nr:bacillithiol biosynthesis deacetylase BshB1 [Bacteroidota bacterium]